LNIYFDNAATSYPKPEPVYEAVEYYMRYMGVSSGRGAYRRALEVDNMVFKARKHLSQLFKVSDVSRIGFTLNVTESLNLALKGFLRPGDHVVTSHMEHNAMWRPLKELERSKRISISVVPSPEGMPLKPADLEQAIRPETRLIALTHASNVTGTLMPLEQIGRVCRRYHIPLLVDAAQTAGVYPIDVEKLNISMLAFTGHKGLLGLTGTGGLYISPDLELQPLKDGGTGGESFLEHMPSHLPDRYEAGTPNLAGIAGLRASAGYLLEQGIDRVWEHEQSLTEYCLKRLQEVSGLKLYGPLVSEQRVGVISFNLKDYPPEDVAYALDENYGIMVRAGLHCSPQGHRCLGTENKGTVRVGLGYFNNVEEIDKLSDALEEIASL